MAAEDKPEVTQDVLVSSGEELAAMIRGEFGASTEDRSAVDTTKDSSLRTEPEIVVEEERTAPARVTREIRSETEQPARSDDRSALLERIERIERDNQNLVREVQSRRPQYIPDRTAPEMVEVLPGVHIPKDPNQRFVRMSPEFVEKVVGLDKELTEPLNLLGNVFFHSIQDMFIAQAMSGFEFMQDQRIGANSRKNAFFSANRDLVDHADLVETVERRARQEGVHVGKDDATYAVEITKRVRTSLARMRGQSYDQYIDTLRTRNPQSAPRQGRAVSGARPTIRAVQRPANATAQQAEIDAVLNL